MTEEKGKVFEQNKAWKALSLFLRADYLFFLILDFTPSPPSYFGTFSSLAKLLSIILLFIAQALWGKKEALLWKQAAALTILTDFLLLFTPFYFQGLSLFVLVHFLRLAQRKKEEGKNFPLWVALLAPALFFFSKLFLPSLMAMGLVYGLFLLLNLFDALSSKNKRLFIAYLFFLSCDLFVCAANLLPPGALAEISRKMIWFFYLPSQVFLAEEVILPDRER